MVKPTGKTYRIGDALGSVLEIYVLDGLSEGLDVFEDDAPAFARVHAFIKTAWAAHKSLRVPDEDDLISDILLVLSWAGDSIYDDIRNEERYPAPPRPKKARDELDVERPAWESWEAPKTRDVEVLQLCKRHMSALDDFTGRLIRQRSAIHAASRVTA